MKKFFTALLFIVIWITQSEAYYSKTNFSYGILATVIANADTTGATFTVTTDAKSEAFPSSNFLVVVYSSSCSSPASCANREIIKITSRTSNTFTIGARNQEGTTHTGDWAVNSRVYLNVTKGMFEEIETEVDTKITMSDLTTYLGKAYYASTDLETQITAIGSTPATLICTGANTLGASLTIPSTLKLIAEKGCTITKASSYTVTIKGDFQAGNYQVFSGFSSGDVKFGETGEFGYILPVTINPAWWGAIGDNTTNNYTAISSAVNAFNSSPDSIVGTVKLGRGRYRIGSEITVPSGVSIEGEGPYAWSGGTTIYQTDSTKGIFILTSNYGTKISNLALVGNSSTGKGIYVNGGSQNYFEHIYIKGFGGTGGIGMHLYNTIWNTFVDVELDTNETGLWMSGIPYDTDTYSNNNNFVKLKAIRNGTGIRINRGTGNTFIGANIEQNTDYGLYIDNFILYYDAQSANFTVGANVYTELNSACTALSDPYSCCTGSGTGTCTGSGATGVITSDKDDETSGGLTIKTRSGVFVDNEIIHDSSGGSATTNITGRTDPSNHQGQIPSLAGNQHFVNPWFEANEGPSIYVYMDDYTTIENASMYNNNSTWTGTEAVIRLEKTRGIKISGFLADTGTAGTEKAYYISHNASDTDMSGFYTYGVGGLDYGTGTKLMNETTVMPTPNTYLANQAFGTLGAGGADVFGSWTEVNPKYCSTTTTTNCSVDGDCPGGETCSGERTTADTTSLIRPSTISAYSAKITQTGTGTSTSLYQQATLAANTTYYAVVEYKSGYTGGNYSDGGCYTTIGLYDATTTNYYNWATNAWDSANASDSYYAAPYSLVPTKRAIKFTTDSAVGSHNIRLTVGQVSNVSACANQTLNIYYANIQDTKEPNPSMAAVLQEGNTNVTVTDSSDGYITFTEDGAEKMRLTGGKLVLGKAVPDDIFHVYGSTVNAGMKIETSAGNDAYIKFQRESSNGWIMGRYNTGASFQIAYHATAPAFGTNDWFNIHGAYGVLTIKPQNAVNEGANLLDIQPTIRAMTGESNTSCVGATNPYSCCTGAGTGTCTGADTLNVIGSSSFTNANHTGDVANNLNYLNIPAITGDAEATESAIKVGTGWDYIFNATNFSVTGAGLVTAAGGFSGNASTATALATNGANCSSGYAPLGVDASGAVESCFQISGVYAPIASPTFTGTFAVASYERHVQIPIVSAQILGSSDCPARNTVYLGKLINANTDLFYLQSELPSDWAGDDAYIELDWYAGADIADTETVILKMSYSSVAENADLDSSTVYNATDVTYTSSGTTSTGMVKHSRFTMTAANLTAGKHIFFKMYRDATTDTYNNASGICATAFEMIYNSTGMPRM